MIKQLPVCHDKTRVILRGREMVSTKAVAKCGEKIIIPPKRRRSANELHYSQQMIECERNREKIEKKTNQRGRSIIFRGLHREIER